MSSTRAAKHKFLSEPFTVGVLGAGYSGGQPKGGVEQGPARLVEFGLIKQLKDMGWYVDFAEEFPSYDQFKPKEGSDEDGIMKNVKYSSQVCKSVHEAVAANVKEKKLALTLGGDHSIGMGTVSGSAQHYGDELRVIWVDAHADINTPASTKSGNLHGCPVSFLMGLPSTERVKDFKWLQPCLKPQNIVYIGLRDVERGERELLKQYNIKSFTMYDVDKHGIGSVVEQALNYLAPNRDKPIHLSFDVDGLDPSVAPATGTPVRGGLSFREGCYICEAVCETGLLVAMDLVEVNPSLGTDASSAQQTLEVGCSLVRSALGETLI